MKQTFLAASSTSSLGHTRLTGSETMPNGCPRDSLVVNQSCAHWRAKLKETIKGGMNIAEELEVPSM